MKKVIKQTGFILMLTFIAVQFAFSALVFNLPAEQLMGVQNTFHHSVRQNLSRSIEEEPSVTADLKGFVWREGQKILAENAVPGEEIIWEMNVKNSASQNISNINLVGNVPDGTKFVNGSANSQVEYSLDRKSFTRNPMIRDATGHLVPAPASLILAIRFTVSLNSNETKLLTYKTTVN